MTKATAKPVPTPSAASMMIHNTNDPAVGAWSTRGQHEKSARVTPRDRMTRAGPTLLDMPGIGTNTNTPATRTSVNKKPIKTAISISTSPRIAANIAQNGDRIRDHLLSDPGQRNDKGCQKCNQPRNRIERGILDGGQDLNDADDNAHYKSNGQQRRRHPKRHHQRLAQDLDHQLRCHAKNPFI